MPIFAPPCMTQVCSFSWISSISLPNSASMAVIHLARQEVREYTRFYRVRVGIIAKQNIQKQTALRFSLRWSIIAYSSEGRNGDSVAILHPYRPIPIIWEIIALAKQLRLDPAQLTDVGRKREHNEDNMAYVIPKDQQVMAKKGALFIVADGMGGHAAGEVASEIAVDTISNMYYQDDSDEVATSLLRATKRANALIHQRAAENMLRSGMGTTCVAAVLRGNMAYIANVGDSRAYLVRNGKVKQVSQDHSWVAEQVRAGLLTEDQARTHAQRNVITRSLGTQADVEIDVFPELLEEHDALVLCTDGLSGLVTDDEIRRIVNQSGP